jgi:hypothetical protein
VRDAVFVKQRSYMFYLTWVHRRLDDHRTVSLLHQVGTQGRIIRLGRSNTSSSIAELNVKRSHFIPPLSERCLPIVITFSRLLISTFFRDTTCPNKSNILPASNPTCSNPHLHNPIYSTPMIPIPNNPLLTASRPSHPCNKAALVLSYAFPSNVCGVERVSPPPLSIAIAIVIRAHRIFKR